MIDTNYTSDYMINIQARARNFLIEIFNHYTGTTEEKLEKSKNFIDEILFKSQFNSNPFSNETRETFEVAYYLSCILIPSMLKEHQKLQKYKESDPFILHDWN